MRLVVRSGFHFEGPVFHIFLNDLILELSANQSLGIEDGVGGIFGNLVLGSISDQPFVVSEGNIGGSGSVSLIIGNDLNSIVLPDTDAGVGGTQINTNSFLRHFSIAHFLCFFFNYKVFGEPEYLTS